MEEIKAPFTDEQVKELNAYQAKGRFHPFTCIGQMKEQEDENGKFKERTRSICPDGGKLIATKDGWVCPCGEYKQDWAHAFMASAESKRSNDENI